MKTLLEAINDYDLGAVEVAIQAGRDVNKVCENNALPLVVAVEKLCGDRNVNPDIVIIIGKLLEAGADFNVKVEECRGRAAPLLHRLIEAANTRFFCSPFFGVESDARKEPAIIEVITLLINNYKIDLEVRDFCGNTPILAALNMHNHTVVNLLLGNGVNLLVSNSSNSSVLQFACSAKMWSLAEQCVGMAGIDINQADKQGFTALDCAKDNLDIALLLLQHGAHSNHWSHIAILEEADKKQHAKLIDHLFEKEISQYQDQYGNTALHLVHSECLLRRLLQEGADLNAVSQRGLTPLLAYIQMVASNQRLLYLLLLLNEYHANFSITNAKQQTALHIFVEHSMQWDDAAKQVVKFLIAREVAINAQDQEWNSVLHLAARHNLYWQKMLTLIEENIDVNLADQHGSFAIEKINCQLHELESMHGTPMGQNIEQVIQAILILLQRYPRERELSNYMDLLRFAAYYNCLAIIEEILERGIDINSVDLLAIAVTAKHLDLVDWLLTHGVDIKQSQALRGAIICIDLSMVQKLGESRAISLDDLKEFLNYYSHYMMTERYHKRDLEQRDTEAIAIFSFLIERLQESGVQVDFLTEVGGHIHRQQNVHWIFARDLLLSSYPLPADHYCREALTDCAISLRDVPVIKNLFVRGETDVALNLELMGQAVWAAVKNEDLELFEFLISKHKFDIDKFRTDWLTRMSLLEYVFYYGRSEKLAHYLITKGANLYFPSLHITTPLHEAVKLKWSSVVELLLQPQYHFPIELKTWNFREQTKQTALQLAIELGLEDMVALLLKHGADGGLQLAFACMYGNVNIVKLILDAKADIKVSVSIENRVFGFTDSKKSLQAVSSNADNKGIVCTAITKLLLQNGAEIDVDAIRTAIGNQVELAVLKQMLDAIVDIEIAENKLLHIVIRYNRLDLVEYLLMRCKDLLLNSLNMNGETPLHLAVQQGNQAIYDLLVAAGADKTSLDYVGNSLAMQAFIYDTYVKIAEFHNIEALLILPGFLSEFKKLEVIFAEQPEFVAKQLRIVTHERDIRLYCHKLIVLFGSADLGWQYIQAHSSAESRQPIHDLCLFNLPPANLKWDRSAWAALALQHGTQLTEYLNFAPRIEALLGSKPPNSLQAIIAVASDIRYNREAENPELANLFIKYKIPESAFDRVLDAYRLKAEDKMPDLSIDGAVVGESHYYFKKLAPNDLRGFVLGAITHCCQSVGSAGEACVRHGMTSSYAGFYAVFKRPNQKEVARVGRLIDSAKAVSNLPDFLKNLPKDQSKKYAGAKSLDVLRAEFAAELERVSKDELVAQLFACLTNQGSLLFDSWEGLRVADNYLCKKFLVEAARKVIVNHRIPKVLLGKGGRTPADLQFTTADKPETPIDYVDYRDSKEQFIVATQEGLQNAVATTRARTAENLVQHSAVFAGPPGHNPEQMMMQMKEFCGAATNIDVLPFVRDPNPDCSNLKGYLDQDISAEKVILLPIYKENNSWTCLFARLYPDRSKYVAYLDPLATSSHVPNYLSSCISDNHSIAKTTAEYVEDPAQTGSWLIDVMRNFVATGQLVMYSSAFAGCLGRKLETECVSGPI